MDLGKIGKKGLGNLGSGILGNHKKGGMRQLKLWEQVHFDKA